MSKENAEVISEALLSMLNKKFSEASEPDSENSLFRGLSFYRKKRRIMSEEEILGFWKRNVIRSKAISLCALVLPIFTAFLLFQGVLEPTTVCLFGLGGTAIYAFHQLILIGGLERLLGTWRASSLREARKTGENRWKFFDALEDSSPSS
ncbi:MAG: hypothetical protein K5905_30715 [Roseibium sp.]|uniref:hypothetical protein n=1 Tax=Roseibium sp. TaxID=1936156 RepID=UPI002603B9F9|nr:hypothetical protein [Roseibium sp.]MCV0429832.1 hypothetical protein [Roseibium sp.]